MYGLTLLALALTTDPGVFTDTDVWVCKMSRKQYVHLTRNDDPKRCRLQREKGSTWVVLQTNADGSMYSVDSSRVKHLESGPVFWLKEDYSANPKRLFFFEKVSVVTTEYKLDCDSMTIQALTIFGYDPKGVRVILDETDSELATIGPDTTGALLAKHGCE